ncbi:long-chain fatty acid--CoA ligase [Schaalia sp. ZJ405]|uniref:AMP-dependent synthetase/ligase n=1 Tax=Schaalia sp. ZJ405 TaxID=2709403 RepID=UPI0013EA2262|nr:AMP-dependent synthetase/ligase [Schaalia sp. ZJ405]QPK80653.1 long-chain fatty acid--CoA ligase [Schaalia sp. ZJ405]
MTSPREDTPKETSDKEISDSVQADLVLVNENDKDATQATGSSPAQDGQATPETDIAADSATADALDELGENGATTALEWHAPVLVRTDEHTTIPELLKRRVQRSPRHSLILRKQTISDSWIPVTARDFYAEVQAVAAGLIALGLHAGERIAIMSHTRYEWTLLDFASWTAGLVPVPIYETSSIDQCSYVLRDAQARVVFTETITMAEVAKAAAERAGLDDVRVHSFDSEAIETLIDQGATTPRSEVSARTNGLTTDDIATIVYTSGTTGEPKGTVITHGNFTELCVNAHAWMPEIAMFPESRLLLFLPLAHVFARFLEVFQIASEGVLGLSPDTKNLLPDLATFKPTYLLVVPRVLEKIYNSADAKASAGGTRKIFRWAADVAIRYSKALDTEEGPSRSLKAQRAVADKLVYQKILKLVGGNVGYIVSGGAPLSTYLGHFYRGLGIPVLEGYGLTETVGPVSVGTPRLSKIGTVGCPLPPMSVRISDEGEVLLKGPSVFAGYNNKPEATAAAFTEDGWFKTGDLGSLDRDGYLTISGRAKEIIVTAGGKNVAPTALEDPLRAHPLISQVIVVGEKRPFISALITLDAEMLPLWLKAHSMGTMSVAEAANNIEVLASLERAVASANEHVSRAESIRKIKVLTTDFTEANGLLTPSLKVKRNVALKRFASVIDEIYGGPVED